MDNAGNLTETAVQTIMVDTITPSLSLQVDGTRGQNDFYTTSVTVTPNASDATSGINKIEAMIDNGAWTVINSPLFFADGNHSYQVRVTDNAGNVTETPMQTLYIDASPAVIAMLDDALVLGDGLFYSIEDSQSGLTELRVVIKDNEGKYQRVTWVENLDGNSKYKGSMRWDGIFSDGTYPTPGIYYIALKVINGAGVETIGTATIEVPVVKTAEQESLPALVMPALETVETVIEEETVVTQSAPQVFGSTSNPFTGNSIQTSFSANSTTTPTQSNTTSNVLWGGAAAALLGATLAEWQKKREEEEAARRAAMRNSGGEEEDDRPRKKTPGQIAYEKKQQQKRIVAESQALMNQKKATQQAQSKIAKDKNLAKAEAEMSKVKPVTPYVASSYLDKEEETWLKGVASQGAWAAVNAQEEAKKAEQERLNDVSAARWAGVASVAQVNGKIQYDLTSWMPLVINRNLQSPELAEMRFYNVLMQPGNLPTVQTYPSSAFGPYIVELFGTFRSLNTGGGRWDIKLDMQYEFRRGPGDKDAAVILCSNSGTCRWVDYSVAGNILYGATAADVGVPREVSKLAGGLLEIKENTVNWDNLWNLCEDPYDTKAVEFGYDLYESTGGNITEEAFRDALTDEVLNSFQPPPEGFVPPFEAHPQPNAYPADRFDHSENEEKP